MWGYSSVPFHFNKTLLHKSSCVIKPGPWSLVAGPKVKSSSLEITNPALFRASYHLGGPSRSSGQGENTQSSSCSDFLGYTASALLAVWCACLHEWHALHEAGDKSCSVVLGCLVMIEGSPPKGYLVRSLYLPAKAKRHLRSLLQGERPEMGEACGLNFRFLVSFSWSLWSFHNCVGN